MASVDKVQVSGTKYDLAPSASGTLSSSQYSSGDSSSVVASTGWTESSPIIMSPSTLSTNDSNSSIFTKVTTMIKNVRWLYAKLGTTDFSSVSPTVSGALNNLQNNKSPKTHSHTTETLPVSNTQVNSDAYVPTSSLVYSMNETLTDISGKATMGTDFTTTVTCGAISAGTAISGTKPVKDVIKNMLYEQDDPNTRYESVSLGTWSNTSDVNTFLSTYTHDNNYENNGTKLKLGNYVTINDGTYNVDWEIAGFDCEYNQTAADGTTYNNGYGILMIPKTQITTSKWNSSKSSATPYVNSLMHTSTLVTATTNMQNILGSHMIQRNVLLGSAQDTNKATSNYTWTTSYLTLMPVGQMTGTFASHNNQYDDGEANYKLPVFNYENYYLSSSFWTRGVYGKYTDQNYFHTWRITSNGLAGTISHYVAESDIGVRPLMLLR